MKLFNAFKKYRNQPQRTKRHASKRQRRGGLTGSLSLEPLEHRVLMSVVPAAGSAEDGSLAAQVAPDFIPGPIQPRTFVVNSTGDRPDINPGDGVCDSDGIPFTNSCTLRAAIMEANASGNLLFPDRIEFDIPPIIDPVFGIEIQRPHTIRPNSPLPTITDPVVINATTQDGYVDKPVIELDGTHVSFLPGLHITAGNTTVRGLAINRFYVGIQIEGGGGNRIQGNYIGTNLQGTGFYVGYDSDGNQLDMANGIVIQDSANNLIGGTVQRQGNLISGSVAPTDLVAGVLIIGDGSTGNSVLGNLIGTNASGTGAVANTVGVLVHNADNNTIGGTTPSARNIISANNEAGVALSNADGNVVQGNYIGPDPTGFDRPVKVSGWSNGVGVVITGLSDHNTIGGTAVGAGNVISGNEAEGIIIQGGLARDNFVQGNRIGITAGFAVELSNGSHGVLIHANARDNTIGGTTQGAQNVIAGNHGDGVRIEGTAIGLVSGNRVQGNWIGNFGGVHALPNYGNGVRIVEADSNTVGGDELGAGNVIAGNAKEEVAIVGIHANDNVVQGNLIGTNSTGDSAIGGTGGGVYISGARRNLIGGTTELARNLISGNDSFGVLISGSTATENRVQGNYIGTNLAGTEALPNGTPDAGPAGVYIIAPGNTVGGTGLGEGNVISGNYGDGVLIEGEGSTGNKVQGNLIGTTADGQSPLGNAANGVHIDDAPDNTIGGMVENAGNIISGNGANGILIEGDNATGNVVAGNQIGTNTDGSGAVGNVGSGVIIQNGAAENIIGGTSNGARNVISGNGQSGVIVGPANPFADDAAGAGNRVQGNYIGTTTTGDAPLGNAQFGILILKAFVNADSMADPPKTLISQNVISANGGGININRFGDETPNVSGVEVKGNYIGTTADGMAALGNNDRGIDVVGGEDILIGGNTPEERNVISASEDEAIFLRDGTTQTVISGNYIGTNAQGTGELGNYKRDCGVDGRCSAVRLSGSSGNRIGGTQPGEGNVIAGNGHKGVFLFAESEDNVVQGNWIGLAADGAPMPNGSHGVYIQASSNNMIGGLEPGAGNTIAFNGGDGVSIIKEEDPDAEHMHDEMDEAAGNAILGNSIFSNAQLGIDLGDDGVTPNDPADADEGANNLQNFPLLTSATSDSASMTIKGNLESVADTEFRIEFFSSGVLDPTGFGEGEAFLGAFKVMTDAAGFAVFSVTIDVAVPAGQFATATATNLDTYDTSEFSEGLTILDAVALSTEALLVQQLYRQVLSRDPEAAGWQYWTDQIAAGTASLGTIATGIFESNERIDPIIGDLYRDYLGREVESAGLDFWRGVWRADGGPDNVVAGIVSSPEFFHSVGGTSRAWVTQLYLRMLSRDPDDAGLNYWTERLSSGQMTRQQIVLGFVRSDENFRNLAVHWYQQYLGRPVSQLEQDRVVTQLREGASQRDIQIEILDSQEYVDNVSR